MNAPRKDTGPRVVEVDLATGRGVRRATPDGGLAGRLAPWSGPALALARALEAEPGREPFMVSVGDAVRRGLPTAARATVVARSPMTGRLAAGQVGSDLGRRLASVADLLSITGRTTLVGAVLVLDADGAVRLVSMPELCGLDPEATGRALESRLGACASLRVGPAGECAADGDSRVSFANLAAGSDPPSFVGRGGLGAALGRLGLKAIVVTAPPVPGVEDDALMRALRSSPRLLERAEGGTHELNAAFGARGDLRGLGYGAPVAAGVGERIDVEMSAARRERHGCRGCPTPCGWVFEREEGGRQGAKFSATYALGTNLGLESFDDSLALLARCDAAGMDAKEAGAVLALWARAKESGAGGEGRGLDGGSVIGSRAAFETMLDALAHGREEAARLARGAAVLARTLGQDRTDDVPLAAGEAARPEASLASILGQCAGMRGAEPMRTFPFLVADGVSHARLASLVAPLPLPRGAEDPRDPAGKGRIVWWHENLVTAVDACGFCAFSAAGLLADGVCTLDELAEWIAPAALASLPGWDEAAPGQRLLALGASLLGVQRELDTRAGALPDPTPDWARESLSAPQMEPEYRRLRGLDAEGHLTPAARARLGSLEVLAHDLEREEDPQRAGSGTRAGDPTGDVPRDVTGTSGRNGGGSVTLRSFGLLARSLGRDARVELELPATVREVLVAAGDRVPDAAHLLVSESEPVPAVYRSGLRLAADARVSNGDVLDLVLAIAGG